MSLEDFADMGYEVDDEDYFDLSGYEEVDLNDIPLGEEITGKPIISFFTNESEFKSDSVRVFILSEDEEGTPIKVKFYCNVPKPTGYTNKGLPLCDLFKNNKYDANSYNVIYSILKLKGMKNINDKEGNPVNSFKNVCAQAYLEILGEQEEITIKVKEGIDEYNTMEIVSIK